MKKIHVITNFNTAKTIMAYPHTIVYNIMNHGYMVIFNQYSTFDFIYIIVIILRSSHSSYQYEINYGKAMEYIHLILLTAYSSFSLPYVTEHRKREHLGQK